MNIVLLCGGSGRRLWPLSNDVRSKQFIEAFRREDGSYESMLQRICRQFRETDPEAQLTFATSRTQVSAIRSQLGEDVMISAEPARKDTLPAIVLAAEYLRDIRGVREEEPVIVCPVDSFVGPDYYSALKDLEQMVLEDRAKICLLGVEPAYPNDQYGYILPEDTGKVSRIREFREKPAEQEAAQLIRDGALWNCGVFAFRLGTILAEGHRIFEFDDYQDLITRYESLEPVNFDRGVVEREPDLAVMRFAGSWKKLDTWENLIGEMAEPNVGNVHLNDTCENVHVINELDIPVLCLGLEDVIVSASPEGILVTDRTQSAHIKPMVDQLSQRIMFAEKYWGRFQVLDVENESMTVKCTLSAGHRMSYHSHFRRDEVWTVISGTGRTLVDGMEQPVQAGDVITMQAGCRHTIIADTELKLIEVQLGREISVHDKQKYELED